MYRPPVACMTARSAGSGRPCLETPRLTLTPSSHDDLTELHRLWTHPAVRRFLFDDVIQTRSRCGRYIDRSEHLFRTRGFGHWTMRVRGYCSIAGFAALEPGPFADDVELIYGLHPRVHGKGIAREAAQAVLQYGFEHAGLARITACVDIPNLASRRVVLALGMHFERYLPAKPLDMGYFALARDRFKADRSLLRVAHAPRGTRTR